MTILGYLVVAPNLLGHALRKPGVDFQVQTLADDLLPYLQAAEYDIIIGHSLGAHVVLSLLKYLPKIKPTSVVLIDPAVEITAEQMVGWRARLSNDIKANPTAEDYMALNPLWTREDAIWRVLGTHIARPTNSDDHIDVSVCEWHSRINGTDGLNCCRATCHGHFHICSPTNLLLPH
jgi:pimeloyl-ACP methyl ester carboxylesterase